MASTVSVSLSVDPDNHLHHHNYNFYSNSSFIFNRKLPVLPSTPRLRHPISVFCKYDRCTFKSSSSSSSHSSSSSTLPSAATTNSNVSSYIEDPYRTGRFLSNEELEKLKFLESFIYSQELEYGSLRVRMMRTEEMDDTVGVLAESFVESMLLPSGYISLLRFLVKQYLIERRALMPHAVTLIGFYIKRKKQNAEEEDREEEEEEEEEEAQQLAGTVEVCFDERGANASPPTPTPPKNSPYICNMTVKQPLRRRGIGRHLLKASEELIYKMSSSREVYLHCRMIDTTPLNMYTKAGYRIIKTDSILILLLLQRRKHLMCKELSVLSAPSKPDLSASAEESKSLMDPRHVS